MIAVVISISQCVLCASAYCTRSQLLAHNTLLASFALKTPTHRCVKKYGGDGGFIALNRIVTLLFAAVVAVPLAAVGLGAHALCSAVRCNTVQSAESDNVQVATVDELQADELADDVLLSLERSGKFQGV
jgi:hypothetical protein